MPANKYDLFKYTSCELFFFFFLISEIETYKEPHRGINSLFESNPL